MWLNLELSWWLLVPPAVVVLLAVWGLIWPQQQWRLFYQRRDGYRRVTERDEQNAIVRGQMLRPFLVGLGILVLMGIALATS